MKRVIKEPGKIVSKKAVNKNESKPEMPDGKKFEDVQRLVHLLQVHQVELEHQNEELRIAQEELEVSRNKYVNLFDFSPIPYFTLDAKGIIKEVNLSAGKMFGADRRKIIGKNFLTYIPLGERDVFNSFIKNIFNSPVKHSCELEVMNKDKRVFHVLLEAIKLEDTLEPDNKCQVALIDLTDYKKVEKALKVTNEKLQILNVSKDKLFSIIAHDLRSPFQSLLSSSDLLATEIESLSQEDIIFFSRGLNDNLKNLYGLLENLLTWSMMKRNMLEYKQVNLNLYDEVNRLIVLLKQNAQKKNISISNNIDTAAFVFADANMLRSVVQNLIINAIKFTEVEGQIIVSSVAKSSFIEVSVQDTGIGIESAKISELFDFSAQASTNGTEGEKGTGLGLPLCKEFVEKNGGKIWVESELGKGSKFIFTLTKAIK